MGFLTTPLGVQRLPETTVSEDKKNCRRYGPCGVGDLAIYLNSRYISRRYYVVWDEVSRLFKRIAMSKGGYTGKGIFGSMPFLVVELKDGSSKEFPFKHEADVDNLLSAVQAEHPNIPIHSAAAEWKLAEAEAAEEARYLKELSREASDSVAKLEEDKEYLELNVMLSEALTSAAKQKRIVDKMPFSFRLIGFLLTAVGIIAIIYGVMCLATRKPYAIYFILGGGAAFFTALSSGAMPNKWNSKARAELDWHKAIQDMKENLAGKPDFSLPAQYAHPVVIDRIVRIIREGRAEGIADAFKMMKNDLKALDNTVTVSQKEYDEIVKIKPLFLVCDYKDEI